MKLHPASCPSSYLTLLPLEGHNSIHPIECNVSVRLLTVQGTENHLAHQMKTTRYYTHLAMAVGLLKSQAEARKGREQQEVAHRHGGLGNMIGFETESLGS